MIDLLIDQQQKQQQRQQQKQQKRKEQSNTKDNTNTSIIDNDDLAVQFQVLDARNLPFKEKYFDLIIDKGTLDAMLSDENQGKRNCIRIISEASRLLANGGKIFNFLFLPCRTYLLCNQCILNSRSTK